MKEVMTVQEAADAIGVCTRTIRRIARKGILKVRWRGVFLNQIGGIYRDSVETLLERRKANHE